MRRQAALGDAMCRLFGASGWDVHREFYYNDAGIADPHPGGQRASARARLRARPSPVARPTAINGEYIADIAADFLAGKTVQAADARAVTATGDADDLDDIRQFAVAYLRREQDLDLQAFDVQFDNYYLEAQLYTSAAGSTSTVEQLIAAGKTYEQDGALWLRTTD